MKQKITLTEKIIIPSRVPDILPLEFHHLKNNVIKNYSYDEKVSDHPYLSLRKYYNLTPDKNLQWVHDFVIHHMAGLHKTQLRVVASYGIILFTNQYLEYHQHVDELRPNESPDYTCLVAINVGEKPVEVKFKYDTTRNKNLFGKKLLKKKDILLLSSDIPHSISTNYNEEPTILLSLQYFKI